MEHPLTTLFQTYTELENPPIVELQNIKYETVGAIYFNELRYKKFYISETNNSERYYLWVDGLGIYFSYFKKLNL